MHILFMIGSTLTLTGIYLISEGRNPDDIYCLLNAYKTTGVGLLFLIPPLYILYYLLEYVIMANKNNFIVNY
jgi:hypothetical protein